MQFESKITPNPVTQLENIDWQSYFAKLSLGKDTV